MHRKTRLKKTGMIYLTVAKNFRADFYFSKKGDNEIDFGKLFLFREKVNGNFYLVRKNRLFFVGLLVYNSTHLCSRRCFIFDSSRRMIISVCFFLFFSFHMQSKHKSVCRFSDQHFSAGSTTSRGLRRVHRQRWHMLPERKQF